MHAKAKSYDWPFTVGDQRPKFPTQYTIPPTGKDPFRMLIRDYVKMEAEKDDRTHGFLDGVLRMGTAGEVQPRFMECMKLTLPGLTFAEFAAVAATGGIISPPLVPCGLYRQLRRGSGPGASSWPGNSVTLAGQPGRRGYDWRSACRVRHAWVATCRLNWTSGRPRSWPDTWRMRWRRYLSVLRCTDSALAEAS